MGLWDGDGFTHFRVDRLILSAAAWSHPVTVGLLWLAVAAGLGWLGWCHLAALQAGRAAAALGWGSLGLAGVLAAFEARRIARFVASRDRFRARLVAPVAAGPQGMALLRELSATAMDRAAELGFAVCITNLDVASSLLPAFSASKKNQTVFMQKRFEEKDGKTPIPNPDPFEPNAFFDPRDLS